MLILVTLEIDRQLSLSVTKTSSVRLEQANSIADRAICSSARLSREGLLAVYSWEGKKGHVHHSGALLFSLDTFYNSPKHSSNETLTILTKPKGYRFLYGW